ncbi:MAG TPA: hypothetical protein DD381_01575 [Lentisphaeria bacterium]|nr:MAG: hypothetical protein A2X47_10455 [Lentisphaerae bacterium GWF2_38_69]HBM15031.1 hypothetical protein [Lentisphaeria bacterium]
MDNKYVMEIISSHFAWGLVIGLAIWLYSSIRFWIRIHNIKNDANLKLRTITAEKAKYMQHLQTQLEVDAESKQTQKKTIETLKTENENLKSMVQYLKNEPKKEELLMLQAYDKAIHLMHERAPGFAPTWEATLREAHMELERSQKGIIPFFKRVIRPSHYANLDKALSASKQLEAPKTDK